MIKGCPQILILDEPTSGVDPVSRRLCWKALNYYKKQLGASFFITSHTTREAEEIGDMVGILSNGVLKKEIN
jgi:ABC-type multidrug transport system ATPase subunit